MSDTRQEIQSQQQYADGLMGQGGGSSFVAHLSCRVLMAAYSIGLWIAGITGGGARRDRTPKRILLTGQFLADGWLAAHARPISQSSECEQLYVVSSKPMLPLERVTYLCPPDWLAKVAGQAMARYLTFAWHAWRLKPEVVGGFHLLCNGLLALLVGKAVGARTAYFCVGGWTEVDGGGARGENRLFGMMRTDDAFVERRLVSAVSRFDLIVTMGTRARDYLRSKGVQTRIEVVPGGIDPAQYSGSRDQLDYDVVGVFRLAPVKRIDVFLKAIAKAAERKPDIHAAIVGDGRLRADLEALCHDLGITERVTFLGYQSNVAEWLRRSRLFLLTSDSEGVALSVMEALTAGCPVIVSDVGDMRDVVRHQENGFLVPRREVDQFADALVAALTDSQSYTQLSAGARESSKGFSLPRVAERWDLILRSLSKPAIVSDDTFRTDLTVQESAKPTAPQVRKPEPKHRPREAVRIPEKSVRP